MSNDEDEIYNGLSDVVSGFASAAQFGGLPVNSTQTMIINNRGNLISNDRTTLSYLYTERGLIQTLVDQPVDDAFRAGFEIQTGQLSPDEIEELQEYLNGHEVIQKLGQALKWGRLYGGGSLMVVTDQDPAKPFKPESLREFSRLDFVSTDMWELYKPDVYDENMRLALNLGDGETNFNYYGHPVHPSRVLTFKGKEAPSFLRQRLRGWGMSEVERVVTSFNQYLKNNNVIFELLDEAKVDIYKIKDMNSALLSAEGSNAITTRIQYANQIKSFVNALTMDTQDEYEQKTMSFSGLSEVLTQIRQGIASDLKMPITKLFGVSSAGFNSGEDDIENYNSMVEGEVRAKAKPILGDVIKIVSQKLFGIMPDDLKIEFAPLRILGAEQEENVKDRQFARAMQAYQLGLISAEDAKAMMNKDNLLPNEVDETDEVFETGFADQVSFEEETEFTNSKSEDVMRFDENGELI